MRQLTIFGHPAHQMLTDIPIGLFIMAFVWQWVALTTRSEFWWAMAFWNLTVGLAAAMPIAIVGFYDFLHIPKENPAKVAGVYHMLSAGSAVACFAASLLAQAGPNPPQPSNEFLVVALSTGGVTFLGVAAWYGAELILRYGIGRKFSIPYSGPERRLRPRERVLG